MSAFSTTYRLIYRCSSTFYSCLTLTDCFSRASSASSFTYLYFSWWKWEIFVSFLVYFLLDKDRFLSFSSISSSFARSDNTLSYFLLSLIFFLWWIIKDLNLFLIMCYVRLFSKFLAISDHFFPLLTTCSIISRSSSILQFPLHLNKNYCFLSGSKWLNHFYRQAFPVL